MPGPKLGRAFFLPSPQRGEGGRTLALSLLLRVKRDDRLDGSPPLTQTLLSLLLRQARLVALCPLGEATQSVEVGPDTDLQSRKVCRAEGRRLTLRRREHGKAEDVRLAAQEPGVPGHPAVDAQALQRGAGVATRRLDEVDNLVGNAL